jgi:enamine deaminase RidA (YjgF/YER057c/UK114 family)
VTSREEYLRCASEAGAIYREMIGRHYPAMAVVEVSALVEPEAKIEIETIAVVPEP